MKNKVTKVKIILCSVLAFLAIMGSSCTRVVVKGKEYQTEPLSKTYMTSRSQVYDWCKYVLDKNSYPLLVTDSVNQHLVTGWMPVTSDSHYMNLFDRRDYGGSQGAYYQLEAKVTEEQGKAVLTLWTKVKSVAGKLDSSGVLENKVFKQVANGVRRPQIDVTNVGIQ